MRVPDRFLTVVREGWRVWAVASWVPQVDFILQMGQQDDGWMYRSKHARTRKLDQAGAAAVYLKAYHSYTWMGLLKDALRPSKALRALVMSDALERSGLATAPVLAAGELRRYGLLRRAFLVTGDVGAPDLREFIDGCAAKGPLGAKREFLALLGEYVARLHEAGFYHGDLVPANVRVRGESAKPHMVLLDNDRTRAIGRPVRLRQARRNLVQLNRFVIRGLTAVDRWRVFRAYCARRHLDDRKSRRLARWVIRKTIERRQRFDGIEAAGQMSFRVLMSVGGPKSPQETG